MLLTGFGPFPGVPHNPTAALVERLAEAGRAVFPRVDISSAVIPTEWATAPATLDHLLGQHKPDAAIHFGVSHSATGFVIETRAANRAHNIDAAGDYPLAPELVADGTGERLTAVPVARVVSRLQRRGLPAKLSHDAGFYLCNAIYYHSLRHHALISRAHCSLFVHLPPTLANARAPLTMDMAVEGGLEIISTILNQPIYGDLAARRKPPMSCVGTSTTPAGIARA